MRSSVFLVILAAAVVLASRSVQSGESTQRSVLFRAGERAYHCYRIPALLVTGKGTVLAFCEARKNSCSDHGDIDLVLKRSVDGGKTWSGMQIVADDGGHTMGNPCPVQDRSTGVIWLPFCRDNKRILLSRSTDDGKTWSKPVDITSQSMDAKWHWVGTGPGHGIQLSTGRLVIPCWADATPKLGEIQLSYCFYSDDHGKTWQVGRPLDANASDECEVVELADGGLYMNARSRQGKKQRAFAFSGDGGKSWSPVKYDPKLPERSCQGSIVRLTGSKHFSKSRIVLASPADRDARRQFTVRVSYDECRTWPVAKVLYAGSAAYSDLAVTQRQEILCLYEADSYSKIVLERFGIAWLTDGADRLQKKPPVPR